MKKVKKRDRNKDELTQADIKNGTKTFEQQTEPHPALETADGENNGAKPAAFEHQLINRP